MSKPVVRTFRPPRWVKVFALLCASIFPVVGVLSYRAEGWSWITTALIGFTLFGVLGVLDALTQRVELHQEHLIVVRNLRKTSYPRSTFTSVTWAKGVPVSLQCTSGSWIRLPGVGPSPQGMVNTLRAWIKAGQVHAAQQAAEAAGRRA
jgi:hypothetical protein